MKSFRCSLHDKTCNSIYSGKRHVFAIARAITCLILLLGFQIQGFSQAANLDQIRNGSAAAPQNPADWVNGNAGPSNAHFAEGYSIPYRMLVTGILPNTNHVLIIEWDTKDQNGHAIDYITHYNNIDNPTGSHFATFGHNPEPIDPTLGITGLPASVTYPIPAPSATGSEVAGQPTASFNFLPANLRLMTVYGGTNVVMTYVFQNNQDGTTASTKTQLSISFTATGTKTLFAWGGHIAAEYDWGAGRGASGVSGSPYHTRLISIDGSGGSQDRSLKASAVVIPPPICAISPAQLACPETAALFFNSAGSSSGLGFTYLWTLTNGATSAGAKIDPATVNSAIVKVIPIGTSFIAGGTFNISLKVTRATGQNTTCNLTPAGTIVKVLVDATATPGSLNLAANSASQLNAVLTGSNDTDPTHYNYAWSQSPASGGSLSATDIANPIFNATAAGTYTFTVIVTQKAAPNCVATDNVQVIATSAQPPCTVTGPGAVCPGTTNTYIYDPNSDGVADAIPTNFTAAWTLENNTNNATPQSPFNTNSFTVISSSTCKSAYRVRLTLTSGTGLITASCTKDVSVDDAVKPVITCPSNKNLQCGESTAPSNTGTATATDNCTSSPVITFSDAPVTANCTGKAGIDRTWTATDGCGNTATCVQQIRFVDLVKPVITCPPNKDLQCGESTAPSNTGTATATDNCTTPVISFTDAAVPANCTGRAGIDRTWLATDGCGNTATCVQQIRFVDLVKPVITCPANKNLQCGESTAPANTGTATATDNCTTPTVTFSDAPVAANCTGKAGIDRTWLATDGCGNTATCVQQIRFVDLVKPVITCPANKNLQCGESTAPANTGTATATDNCTTPAISFTDAPVAPNCTGQAGIDRTWLATDGCGNTASCVQQIRFVDLTPPVITNCPADVVIECSASILPANTGILTATDNCGPVTPTFTDVSVPNGCQTIITRTWVATDGCGNSASCVQHIVRRDRTAPVINCPTTGNATATDNCSAVNNITIYFRDNGSVRTWTAIDESGNIATCTQSLTGRMVQNSSENNTPVRQTVATTVTATSTEPAAAAVKIAPVIVAPTTAVLKVETFPNPYRQEVSFRILSPRSGRALLELYDLVGRKMGIVFEGNVEANILKTVNYKVPPLQRVPLMYRLSVNDDLHSTGKLLPNK